MMMLNEYKECGLKMLDIRSFNYALTSKWVKKYLDDNNQAKWKLFLAELCRPKRSLITIGTGSHACIEIETHATLFSW